jgi:hypothetical protein
MSSEYDSELCEEKELRLDYAREKLWQAIHVLVTSESSLQERLASAAIYLIRLQAKDDFPEEYQAAFEFIVDSLTHEPAVGDEGKIQATTRKMTDIEARQVAERILSLYTQLKGGI